MTIEHDHRLVCEALQVAVKQGRLREVDGGYVVANNAGTNIQAN